MVVKRLLLLCGVALSFLLSNGLPLAAADNVNLDFKEAPLTEFTQAISDLTGKNFVYDSKLRGKVTVNSPAGISSAEAYKLFLSVLNLKGYTVVPSGSVHKIIPIKEAKTSNLPTQLGDNGNEAYVTRMLRLEHLDAEVAATTILSPLVPRTSHITAYPPSNTLIITDSAANIKRLAAIIRKLDVPQAHLQIDIMRLQHAEAGDVAQVLNKALSHEQSDTRNRRARNVATAETEIKSRVLPYEYTNSLVILTPDEKLAKVRQLVQELDQEPQDKRSGIHVYYLENANAEELAKTLNEILTGISKQARNQARKNNTQLQEVSVTADKPTNSLIINATPEEYRVIQGIINKLDIKRKQVFVEALVMELSMDATTQLGISLQGAIETGSESAIIGASNTGDNGIATLSQSGDSQVPGLLTSAINGILLGGFASPIEVTGPNGSTMTVPALSALIDLSQKDTNLNVLSAPRLLTSDNEEAEIVVGDNVPIITSRLTDTGSTDGLAQSVSVERKDVALTLRITPQVTEGNLVRMEVYQEKTDVAESANTVGDTDQVGPTFSTRKLKNTVVVKDKNTVVLGGLISNKVDKSVTKVPVLGDVPLLGRLFRNSKTTEEKTNLLVFIRPHIIRTPGQLQKLRRRNQQALPPQAQQSLQEFSGYQQQQGADAQTPEAQKSRSQQPPGFVPGGKQ